jgi:hypothetical protein
MAPSSECGDVAAVTNTRRNEQPGRRTSLEKLLTQSFKKKAVRNVPVTYRSSAVAIAFREDSPLPGEDHTERRL